MHSRTTLKKHAELLDRMAETVGVDLEEAAMRGRILPTDLADAVLHCTGCSDPEHCANWLNEHVDGAEAPPGYCRNAALLRELKSGEG